jgi:hypothetical protein
MAEKFDRSIAELVDKLLSDGMQDRSCIPSPHKYYAILMQHKAALASDREKVAKYALLMECLIKLEIEAKDAFISHEIGSHERSWATGIYHCLEEIKQIQSRIAKPEPPRRKK